MHALVTGAGGFLGQYIVGALLARGNRVRGLARGEYPQLTAHGVEMLRGDVADAATIRGACQGVDCVFHVASRIGIWGPWREYYQTNVVGTHLVIAGCREAGVRRLVFTSSPSVTFDGRDQCGVNESAPYPKRWLAHYPHSKALAEQAVLAANGVDGMQTCALRPHLIWGPGDPHLVARLIARAKTGRLRRVGDGANLVDIAYVENAAEAHLQAADAMATGSPAADETSPAGKAYFISQGEPVNCWQWIDELLALADLPPVSKSLSLRQARAIGRACEIAWRVARLRGEPPMTRFLANQLATSHWFDIDAARHDFSYTPRVSTAEGMQRLGQWLRKQS
jgi:nucleoside-diphosphate-sugar epimerase